MPRISGPFVYPSALIQGTTAELDALSPAEKARIRVAYSTDCLSSLGGGSVVYWDGTYWRLEGSRVRMCKGDTLDSLWAFFRSCADQGLNVDGPKLAVTLRKQSGRGGSAAIAVTSGNGGSQSYNTGVVRFMTGSAANGYAYSPSYSEGHPALTGKTSYFRADFTTPDAGSSLADGYHIRASFILQTAGISSVGNPCIGLLYDERNSQGLSLANPANFYLNRFSTANVAVDTGVAFASNTDYVFEWLYNSTHGLCAALNGVQFASGINTEIPAEIPNGRYMQTSFGIIKSTGTSTRVLTGKQLAFAQLSA